MAETKEDNEARKVCAMDLWVVAVDLEDGSSVRVESLWRCPHEPKCLPRRLSGRVA